MTLIAWSKNDNLVVVLNSALRRSALQTNVEQSETERAFRTVEDACPYGFGGFVIFVGATVGRPLISGGASPSPTKLAEYGYLFVGAALSSSVFVLRYQTFFGGPLRVRWRFLPSPARKLATSPKVRGLE